MALGTGCLLGKWNDITDGIIQCCNGFGLNESGQFVPFSDAPFADYMAVGKEVWVTISANVGAATVRHGL